MRSTFPTVLVSFAIFALSPAVTADCCRTSSNGYCPDATASTAYCGVGSCNIFGCNCDGGCRQLNQYGCIDAADDALYDCDNGDPSNVGAAVEIFEQAKDFWNVLSFLADLKPKSRIKRRSLSKRDDPSCDTVFNQALQVCATECPGGTQPEEVVDPQSWEPCTGISVDKVKREDSTAGGDDEKVLHDIVDKNGDGFLDLREFLEWANYSSGNTLTDYAKVKPWIRFFFAYDQNQDNKISLEEVGRPRSNVTWLEESHFQKSL